jgi:alkylation response protein AidB-like acyl-CoA dehydrogenase
VAREQVLVEPPDGFKKLMRAYNSQRLGAATVALGLAQGAYEHALAYAQSRRQFGRPIADFQGIRWKLADMATDLDAARLLIHRAAATSVEGFPEPLAAAKPRPSPPRRHRRSPARHCRSTGPPATAARCLWSGWCATRGCSRSAAARWR